MNKDEELIKKYHLDNVRKRISQLCEYTFITKPMLSEDGEEENDNQEEEVVDSSAQMDSNSSEETQDVDNGENLEQDDADNIDNGNIDNNTSDDIQNIPQDVNNGTTENSDFDNIDTLQDGDEVIDVDELTKSQDVSQYKIDGVDDKLTKLLFIVNKFMSAIDQNDKKIDDLKAEFEKRNPTQEEQLNLRSLSSFPFSVNPKDYFETKNGEGNYNIMSDNEVSPQDELYVFKRKDLKNFNDNQISRTLDDEDKLSNYINF